LAIRQNPHSFSLLPPEKDHVCHPANRYPASPRKKIASTTRQEPYAINIRLPPRKRLHWQQAMENEGAIGLTHRSCFRVAAAPTLATKRSYNSQDHFGRSPVFEGKKTGEKGGLQVARLCTCGRNKKHGPISTFLTLSVGGEQRHEHR